MKMGLILKHVLYKSKLSFILLGMSALLFSFAMASTLTWVSGSTTLNRLSQQNPLADLVYFRIEPSLERLWREHAHAQNVALFEDEEMEVNLSMTIERILATPGVEAVYTQCWAYPTTSILGDTLLRLSSAELLNRTPMPLSEGVWPDDWNVRPAPIILDYRLRGTYAVGQTIQTDLFFMGTDKAAKDVELQVAGFLAEDNPSLHLMQTSSEMLSSLYLSIKPEELIAIIPLHDRLAQDVSEALSGTGFIKVNALYEDKTLDRLGYADTTSFQEILDEDQAFLLTWLPVQTIRGITLLLFLLFSMGGLQYALIHKKLQVVSILRLCGMPWKRWMIALQVLFGMMPLLFSIIGTWLTVNIDHLYPLVGLWPLIVPPLLTLLTSQLVMAPFLRHWYRLQPIALWKEAR